MALIQTSSGDFEINVKTTEKLMEPAVVDFTIPVTLPQVQAGSLNEWQPVNVLIPDGGSTPIVLPCWVTKITSNQSGTGNTVDIELQDASVWLWRIGRDTPWTGQPNVLELLASNTDNVETRAPNAALTTSSSLWVGDWGIVTGTTSNPPYRQGVTSYLPGPCYQTAIPGTSPTTADGTITFGWPAFHASGSSVQNVRVKIASDFWKYEQGVVTNPASLWTLTAAVSWDGGTTWGTDHVITVSNDDFDWSIDVTADHAWALSDLTTAGNVLVRLSCSLGGGGGSGTPPPRRFVTQVFLEVAYGPIYGHTMPLLPGAIDTAGGQVTLATDHKMLNEWFTDITEQTAYEWAVNPTRRLGWATFDFQKAVGGTFSATVTAQGRTVQVGGIDVGWLSSLPKVDVDGMAAVNRVVAKAISTTSGTLTTAVADDTASQSVIGVHELVVSGNSTDGSTQLQAMANSILAAHQHSQASFDLLIPKMAGLWSQLRLGATLHFRGDRMPYAPWEGTVRIVERQIDESQESMTLTLLPVATISSSVASGMAVLPQRTAQASKFAPKSTLARHFRQVLKTYYHPRKR